jgi:haloalkane dehalogenase
VTALRTPDERFAGLPGYLFEPQYVEIDGLRMHYIDEGRRDDEPVLLLHGEPSWCYLYRKMVPIITEAGYRAIAPDFFGFGRSDKLPEIADYSYQLHADTLWAFVQQLELQHITLVGQDWGGLIGLRVAAEREERFARIVAANTSLPTGDGNPGEAFLRWRQFATTSPVFDIGRVIQGGTVTELPDDVVAAYNAPFPDDTYKAGARAFPALVPITPDDPASTPNRKAWEVLDRWQKPFLCAFSDSDPITGGADKAFLARVPGTKGQPHTTIAGGGHFLQEDKGEELANAIVRFLRATPVNR